MALTAIELCQHALVKIGAKPIANFEENTTEALISSILYPTIRDALLSTHPWSFATFFRNLSQLDKVASEHTGHSYAFRLPSDFLRIVSAKSEFSKSSHTHYKISGRHLLCNFDTIILHYIGRAHEASFPPFFDQALISRLCADFSLPLTESVSRSQTLRVFAEQELQRARLIDSQQEPPKSIDSFSLVELRS